MEQAPAHGSGLRRGFVVVAAILAAGGLTLASCDDDNDPLLGSGGGGGSGSGANAASFAAVDESFPNGRTLEVFPAPLRVRVLGSRGEALPGARVRWELRRGVGTLSGTGGASDSLGIAEVLVTAGSTLGPIEVRASLEGSSLPAVEFRLQVTAVQIQILADRFLGPLAGDTVDVVAGDTVEWLNRDVQSHLLRSVESPDGGVVIRSDTLRNSDRYFFVPNLAGTWVYEDRINTAAGDPPRGVVRAVGRQDVGGLEVDVVLTAGTEPARGFVVTVDGGTYAAAVVVGQTVTFPVLPAIPHVVRLRDVPLNCVVAGVNPRSVAVVAGDTVSTTFEVGCD